MKKAENAKTVLAVIVPCYNEEAVLNLCNATFLKILEDMIEEGIVSDKSHICYINDGSIDKSWDMIMEFMRESAHIRGISFSRNYGHQSAMLAGIRECHADAYITIDADLQEEPSIIREMAVKFNEGYDIVYGVRSSRSKDSFFKRKASSLFYKIMGLLGSETVENSSEVRLISNKVAEHIRAYTEKNVYLRGIISSIGFKSAKVSYKRGKRAAGETKYPFSKLMAAAIDGLTTTSTKLLGFIFLGGVLLSALSLITLILSVFCVIFGMGLGCGWNLFLLSLIAFTGAIQTFALSIAAQYIGKIFKEVKNRPPYIIDKNYSGGLRED